MVCNQEATDLVDTGMDSAEYFRQQGYEWQACGWVASEARKQWLRRTYASHLSDRACDVLTTAYAMGTEGLRYTKKDAAAVAELLNAHYVSMSTWEARVWVLPLAEACISLITPEPAGSFRIIKPDGFQTEFVGN